MKEKIQKWIILSNRLKNIKADELALRKEIATPVLTDVVKGSKNFTFDQYTMTATAKVNTKLDKDLLKEIWKYLSEAEKACVVFEPKLIQKKYEKLDEKSHFHRAVEVKPGTPTLKLKDLKE